MKKLTYPAAALALLASGAAFAQTDIQDIMNVTAEVVAGCSELTAGDLDFGSAGQVDEDDDTEATITVTCDSGQAYTVEIDAGESPGGAFGRQVTGSLSGQFMDYEIFQPTAAGAADTTTHWGALADGDEFIGSGTGAQQSLIATGRLVRTSGSQAGTYTDAVIVQLNF